MFSTLRTRFGIPGVISVIALVFAMLGGAYAAQSNSGDKASATASAKKAKKGPRGPRGPRGSKGAIGPAGPQGPSGPQGSPGANGKDGASGASGSDGTSAEVSAFSGAKGSCTDGGVEVKSASPVALVCNGRKGTNGKDGEPWTAGGTLPPEATETGVWALGSMPSSAVPANSFTERIYVPISFPIPLETALSNQQAHIILPNGKEFVNFTEVTPTQCLGTAEAPTAEPGNLCVYVTYQRFLTPLFGNPGKTGSTTGTSTVGAMLSLVVDRAGIEAASSGEKSAVGYGTWAVTAAAE